MIETLPYVMKSGAYVRRIGLALVGKYWWLVAVPVIACIIGTAFDIRWLLVLLMIVLIAYPGIGALAFFNYALRPECAKSAILQKAILGEDAIRIVYLQNDSDFPNIDDRLIFLKDIKGVEDSGSSLIIDLHNYDFIEIPAKSFASNEQMTEFMLKCQKWTS